MTQVVKGRCYYDTYGRRWKVIEATKDDAVLRWHLVKRTTAQRKEDGKWWINFKSYLIVEDDR